MSPPPSAFGRLLAAGLERRGLTQTGLAELLGLKQQTVSRWLRAKNAQPRWDTVAKLAEMFGWDLDMVVRALAQETADHAEADDRDAWMPLATSSPFPASELSLGELAMRGFEFDRAAVGERLDGQRVLITGAGGWIGSRLAERIQNFRPSRLILLDRDPDALDRVKSKLTIAADSKHMDVVQREEVFEVFKEWKPDVVFHAAGYRTTEGDPTASEVVRGNLGGLWNVLTAAQSFGVRHLGAVSTPKAAFPLNVIGQTRWLGECLVATAGEPSYCSLRFGSLLDSPHSEVARLKRDIAKGVPPALPKRGAYRYFLNTDHAVDAMLHATAVARNTPILALAFGVRASLHDVARLLIERLNPELGVRVVADGSKNFEEDVVGPSETPSEISPGSPFLTTRDSHEIRFRSLDKGPGKELTAVASRAKNDLVEAQLEDLVKPAFKGAA